MANFSTNRLIRLCGLDESGAQAPVFRLRESQKGGEWIHWVLGLVQ
jgi:hypothetical protein